MGSDHAKRCIGEEVLFSFYDQVKGETNKEKIEKMRNDLVLREKCYVKEMPGVLGVSELFGKRSFYIGEMREKRSLVTQICIDGNDQHDKALLRYQQAVKSYEMNFFGSRYRYGDMSFEVFAIMDPKKPVLKFTPRQYLASDSPLVSNPPTSSQDATEETPLLGLSSVYSCVIL